MLIQIDVQRQSIQFRYADSLRHLVIFYDSDCNTMNFFILFSVVMVKLLIQTRECSPLDMTALITNLKTTRNRPISMEEIYIQPNDYTDKIIKLLLYIEENSNDSEDRKVVKYNNPSYKDLHKKYKYLQNKNLNTRKSLYPAMREERERIRIQQLAQQQHAHRMQVVTEFMKDRQMTTKYLYEEVLRIFRDRQVKDALREMTTFLETPPIGEKAIIKANVLQCFNYYRKKYEKKDPLKQKVNKLVINTIKDPFNDGVE